MELLAFAVGFKALSALLGLALAGGGYLGYRYGAYVQKEASAAVSKAEGAVGGVAAKVKKL